MAHVFFSRVLIIEDLEKLAKRTSYRDISASVDNKISASTLCRIVNKKSELTIKQVEILMSVLHTQYDDYLVKHMF